MMKPTLYHRITKPLNMAMIAVVAAQLWGFVLLVGCTSSAGAGQSNSIEGIVVDVQMCQEDSGYTAFLIEFEDGRLQKLRCRYSNPVTFHTRKKNVISYENNGTIVEVNHD